MKKLRTVKTRMFNVKVFEVICECGQILKGKGKEQGAQIKTGEEMDCDDCGRRYGWGNNQGVRITLTQLPRFKR